jgi:hypothetical protein
LPHSRPIAYGASGGIIVVLGGTIVSVEMGASEPSTSNSSSDEESQSSSLERIILAKYPKSMLVVAPYMVFHIGTTVVGPYVSWKGSLDTSFGNLKAYLASTWIFGDSSSQS